MLTMLILCLSSAMADPPATTEGSPAVNEAAPRTVTEKAHIDGAEGARATVTGTLKRVKHEGTEATAIVLSDDTPIFVSQGAPPEGWDWMLDTQVRVQGVLWAEGKEGTWSVPTLTELDTPMPADVGMPGMGF